MRFADPNRVEYHGAGTGRIDWPVLAGFGVAGLLGTALLAYLDLPTLEPLLALAIVVVAAETAGVLAASVLFGFLVVGLVGVDGSGAVTAIATAILGAAILTRLQHLHGRTQRAIATSAVDGLTGALTRLVFERNGPRDVDRCISRHQPVSIALIDCDRFKALNDRHGHAFGDEVLKLLVASLRAELPSRTVIGRTGGDEFVLVIPKVTAIEARQRLETAARRFADATLVRGGRATFSVGVAEAPNDSVDWSSLLRIADQRMYAAKADRPGDRGSIKQPAYAVC